MSGNGILEKVVIGNVALSQGNSSQTQTAQDVKLCEDELLALETLKKSNLGSSQQLAEVTAVRQ